MIFASKTMHLQVTDAVGFLTFPSFERFGFIRHAFSTRLGGVSKGEFTSMNLSFGRGDSDENVLENYRRICAAAGFAFDGLVASAQDHHTQIRRVGEEQKGVGITRPRDMDSVDGLITDQPGITLVTYYADCVPLFFLDPVHRAIGLAHAGWKGTVGRIGEKMVRRMEEEFGSRAGELVTAIGPSIGPCCYEVDGAVADSFAQLEQVRTQDILTAKGNGKYMLNLWETNKQILLQAGVQEKHLSITDLCTRCNHDLLISHRATGGKRGGMTAMMGLTEEPA